MSYSFLTSKKAQDALLGEIEKGLRDNAEDKTIASANLAKKTLIKKCEPIVLTVIRAYLNDKDAHFDSKKLLRIGNKGLEKAIERWGWKRNRKYRFTIYAAWFIKREIELALSANNRTLE